MAPGVKIGCKSCRRRHIKCDTSQPRCETCQRAGRECQWDDLFRFCHDFNSSIDAPIALEETFSLSYRADSFPAGQKWMIVPDALSFVDEHQQLQRQYYREPRYKPLSPAVEEEPLEETRSNRPNLVENHQSPERCQGSAIPLSPPLAQLGLCTNGCCCLENFPVGPRGLPENSSSVSPSVRISPWTPHASLSPTNIGDGNQSDTPNHNSIRNEAFDNDSIWPLKNAEESYLMAHFIDELAPIVSNVFGDEISCTPRNNPRIQFDLCDNNRHFANIAPRRAMSNSTLLNAIFAVSARHLSNTTDFDPFVADRYNQICLRALIPILNNPSALMDSDYLAATVILRLFEELDVPLAGRDAQGHVRGHRILFCAQNYTEIGSGLGQAAFWVALRQELHIALATQRPILGPLDQCNIDLTLTPATEVVWSYRILVHCGTISRFCFGDPKQQHVDPWEKLVDYQQKWRRSRPTSFNPLFYSNSSEDSRTNGFPLVNYLSEAQVMAAQHHLLSLILLTIFNPHIPRIGLSSSRMARVASEDVRKYVFELCGTALSNRKVAPAYHAAVIGITMCGTHFSDQLDQAKLMYMLVQAEKEHAWPTIHLQEQLKEAWSWDVGG